jgi:undecaprenyl-diphosphatase
MDLFQAILLGFVQGLTEWLPVSSSGHLALVQTYLGLEVPLMFNIALHVGTLAVIIAAFWKDILQIRKAWATYIIVGSIPTALVGYFLHDPIAGLFQNQFAIAIALAITGTLLFYSNRPNSKRKVKLKDSVWIGLAQALAIVPGISRSGATISTGLFRGVQREQAAKFSFILAIPAILGAAIYEAMNTPLTILDTPTIAGTITATLVGYVSLKWLLKLITQKKFHLFAYYCWALAAIVLIYSQIL